MIFWKTNNFTSIKFVSLNIYFGLLGSKSLT